MPQLAVQRGGAVLASLSTAEQQKQRRPLPAASFVWGMSEGGNRSQREDEQHRL